MHHYCEDKTKNTIHKIHQHDKDKMKVSPKKLQKLWTAKLFLNLLTLIYQLVNLNKRVSNWNILVNNVNIPVTNLNIQVN